jgi:cellulose synthase operon protein C
MFALLIAAAVAQPGRDPTLLHRGVEPTVAAKEQEQETTLRRMLQLGGSPLEQAEVLGRLAGLLRSRALGLTIRAQAAADAGDEAAAARDRRAAADGRAEAIARYREMLKKYPSAPRTDEALFFLADTLQESGRDAEAVVVARELTRRFPRSAWAPASHVFVGEHLFDAAKLDEALREYRAAAEVPTDEVYPYALYKAAWCRFNQNAFVDAMKLFKRVVDVSEKSGWVNTVQLAREARRDYVLAYARLGKPEAAKEEFARKFGPEAGLKMLEQYGKLLFDTGRDPEAQLIHRQLLAIHGDAPAAVLDQTRLLVLAQRGGKRRELLLEARQLVEAFQRVRTRNGPDAVAAATDEKYDEASRLAEETLRNLAVQIHNEARKTHLDETWAAGRALYANYLTLFPEAADAGDLRFFYGELLYSRGLKAEAADQYEEVVRRDLASKTPGRWLQKAAWSAVLSRNEAMLHGGAEPKDTGERRAQRPLSADEKKLAAASRLYLQALPDGPHAVEVAFKLGRLEYVSGDYGQAEQHLAFIALSHPEHELSEYAANLVLDIENLRGDWEGVRRWALKFLEDRRLAAHGTLLQDLKRIEEQSAYALADAVTPDPRKADALLSFVATHPHGQLLDKALFGAAAAFSRMGRVDDAIAARARIWKEQPQSTLVPRALLASASDLVASGELGEAASLLERYAAGFQRQRATPQRRDAGGKVAQRAVYDEAQAQGALHDAAVLREGRGELKQAVTDRSLALQLWRTADDVEAQRFELARLRAKAGEPQRAAREMTAIAKGATQKLALQLAAWREAARLYAAAGETGNAQWSWVQLDRLYRGLSPKAREKLPADAAAGAAEASFALGASSFEAFRRQQIRPPLMATLRRKVALLQEVKKRVEEIVALGQAEPAVCALARLGEAQMLLGQGIAQSSFPPGLSAEQRKLYRAALAERAEPLYAEARETLKSADAKALELGVTGQCPQRVGALLEKVSAKAAERPRLALAEPPVVDPPEMVDARAAQTERGRRLLGEALTAVATLPSSEAIAKFQGVVQAAPSAAAHFALGVAFDRAGRGMEAEQAYRAAAAAEKGAVAYEGAARAAALAAARGDAEAAREAVALARAALGDDVPSRVLQARIELALGNPAAAQTALKSALAQVDVASGALCVMARAQLAQGQAGVARIFAARAAIADPSDPEPLLVQAELARAAGDPAAELDALRAAVERDAESPRARLALGRASYERGRLQSAVGSFADAVDLDASSYAAALAYGQSLAAARQLKGAEQALRRAVALAPKAADPHFELARVKLDGDGDAQAALAEAKLFLTLSRQPPPPGHPIHALVQRCEEALKQRAQASVVQTR